MYKIPSPSSTDDCRRWAAECFGELGRIGELICIQIVDSSIAFGSTLDCVFNKIAK